MKTIIDEWKKAAKDPNTKYIVWDAVTEVAIVFHRHLAECNQCEKNPFNLCPVGAEIIKGIEK